MHYLLVATMCLILLGVSGKEKEKANQENCKGVRFPEDCYGNHEKGKRTLKVSDRSHFTLFVVSQHLTPQPLKLASVILRYENFLLPLHTTGQKDFPEIV